MALKHQVSKKHSRSGPSKSSNHPSSRRRLFKEGTGADIADPRRCRRKVLLVLVFVRISATPPQAEDYSLVLSGSTGNQQAIFTHRLPFIIYYLSLIFLNPFRYWRIAVVGKFQKVSSSPSTIKRPWPSLTKGQRSSLVLLI
ncbi:uncharacterized protein [Miscanthus floridulus]